MFLRKDYVYGNHQDDNNIITIREVRYRKIKHIGEGYQSVVFEAKNLNSGFRCAVKVVSFKHHSLREQINLQKAFIGELNLMAKLNGQSAHVAHVFGFDIDRTNMLGKIVMELGSRDFRAVIPLRVAAAAKIVNAQRRKVYWRQMVEAVMVIHKNGITHSDVKPENFIFVGNVLKIIDFGMSFLVPPGEKACTRPFAGTPDYMPPEVCRTVGVMTTFGFKADIWSLGCILYEMTFGKRPFEHIKENVAKMRFIGSLRTMAIPQTNDRLLHHVMAWCLQPTAEFRPSAAQLLCHPYLQIY